jgi:hypothetical protein
MRPLDGIRVLDFSHALAGPLCTYHLALMGADVIKVERPGTGDDLRLYTEHSGFPGMSAPFVAANAGKRSIALDLKSKDGQIAIRQLAEKADVVVENFRPDVAAKLGIDWPSIKAINPQAVYCSVTGFGRTGPLKDWTAYDHIVQAMSGIMWLNGEPEQGPLKVGLPFSDTFSGYVAAFAIVNALFQRHRSGTGQFIDVGMLDATLVLLSQGIAVYGMSGEVPIRTGNRGYRLIATADTYEAKNGYISIGANHQHQYVNMCKALGMEQMIEDPRFIDHAARSHNNEALRAIFVETFKTFSAEELEAKLSELGVPVAKVRSIPEIVTHPHVQERDIFVSATITGYDKELKLSGAGFTFEHDGPLRKASVPRVGEHTQEILEEIGLSPQVKAG